jgi:signal transduction histidine kinase
MDAKGTRRAQIERGIVVAAIAGAFGAIEVVHDIGHEGGVNVPCVTYVILAALFELGALTVVLDAALRRRLGGAWSFALSSVVAITASAVQTGVGYLVERATGLALFGDPHPWQAQHVVAYILVYGILALAVWAVVVVLPFAVRDANASAEEGERLRTAAELARLRAHLQPHFLLNTLNTVAGLVTEEPREARKLLGALGDLLRDSLEETDEMQTIEAEVSWLKRYADILETRHRGMLTFRWDVADAAQCVRVPRLLLQPLLENAVQHGALRRRDGGEVTIRIGLDARGRLQCIVEDNGPGPSTRPTRSGALGIQLVTRRLALKYDGAAAFRLESGEGLTRSIVEIPEAAS